MSETVLDLTTRIVAAHVSRNATDADQLPELIRAVHAALLQAAQPQVQPASRDPAVPVKKSVFQDHIVCLECGKSFRTLKRHLQIDHNLTTDEYRDRFALPRDYPLVAPEYAETRSAIARKLGLGRNRHQPKRGRRG